MISGRGAGSGSQRGESQRTIKRILDAAFKLHYPSLRFADIRLTFATRHGGKLDPVFERSLKRALKGLVERGDVLIVSGKGGQTDPFRYVTVECFTTGATGEKVTDTAHAKQMLGVR